MIKISADVRAALDQETIDKIEKRGAELDVLFRDYGKKFEPYAFYQDDLDCIRVVVRDCSTCEFRITEWLTVLNDTDPQGDAEPVGFTLKGIRVLSGADKRLHERILKITELLDEVIKKDPQESVRWAVAILRKLSHRARIEDVSVSAAQAA